MSNSRTLTDTELKLAVSLEVEDLTMDDYDFSIDFYTTGQPVTVKKDDMRRNDEKSYTAIVDTSQMGAGRLRYTVTAYVVDADCEDGQRTIKACFDTDIKLFNR